MLKAKKNTSVVVAAKKKPMSRRRIAFIIACCIFPVLNWLVFYIYVNLSSFTLAFTNKDGVLTLANFIRFWKELRNPLSDISIAFRNTFLTFGINLITYPLKVLVAYFIYKKVPGAALYRILFFVPKMLFDVAEIMIITKLLSPQGFIAQGIGEWLNLGHVPELLADSRFANTTVFAHLLWSGFAGNLIIWGGTFARIPEELSECGRIDGTTWWTEFTKITVPLVWPQIALDLVLSFCGIFSASGAVFLLTKGNYGTMTLTAWMYLQVYNVSAGVGSTNAFNYLSAVGFVLTFVSIVISLIVRRYTDKAFDDVQF